MNIHIKLVKKWLADPESVTKQELKDNRTAANAAAYTANATAYAYAAAVSIAANVAFRDATDAAYWVKLYEELEEQE